MNFTRKFKKISDRVIKYFFTPKENHIRQIVIKSVFCFVFGALITTCFVININDRNENRGQGGFETSVVPEFNEYVDLKDDVLISKVEEDEVLTEIFIQENQDNEKIKSEIVEEQHQSVELTYLTYRVQSGDMIGLIADKYGVTQDTIISINNIRQSRLIQVGQYLKIPSMPGILYTVNSKGETPETIAAKFEVSAEKCASINNIAQNVEIASGTSLFVPDAQLDWATKQEINGDLFKKPIHNKYYLSSYYGWRDSPFNTGKRSFHGGIDMACPKGTPIYPSMDGKVTATGYNSTYGNYVIIQHHSGYKTLYGHMSKILCKKGNFVYTNTKIGLVGSTGLSTGPHLHFTVYKNGKSVNPLPLLNK